MIFTKIRYLFFAYISIGLAKLLFIDLPPVVSATAIIIKDGKLLCLNLSYYKGLGLPGGLINSNEESIAALQREVYEETGLTITQTTFLGTASAPFRGIHCMSLVYLIKTTGTVLDSKEGTLQWVNPEEALDRLVYPNAQLALKLFINTKEL